MAAGEEKGVSAFAAKRAERKRTLPDDSSSDEDDPVKQFKVVVLGDGAVGKTSLCNRMALDSFSHSYKQTVGTDFFLRRFELPGDVIVQLQLWDIGGQSLGSKMISRYLSGADAVVYVYDITNAESFHNLEDWLSVATASDADSEVSYSQVLIGNKTDLSHVREVKMAEHDRFARSHGMGVALTSAKTGDGVDQAFLKLAAQLAGVKLTRPDIHARSKIIAAELVNHERNDPKVEEPDIRGAAKKDKEEKEKRSKCVVM